VTAGEAMTPQNAPAAPDIIWPAIDYSPRAMARVVQSYLAELTMWHTAKDMPTSADDPGTPEAALRNAHLRQCLADATTCVAVLNARLAGVTWETIGSHFLLTEQAAIDQYEDTVQGLRDQLLLHWLRGPDKRDIWPYLAPPSLRPESHRLDKCLRHFHTYLGPAPSSDVPDRPVSGVLRLPDHAEHGALLMDAAEALWLRPSDLAPHYDQVYPLEVGYGRRLVQFWWTASQRARDAASMHPDQVSHHLDEARAYVFTVWSAQAPKLDVYATHATAIASYLVAMAAAKSDPSTTPRPEPTETTQ